MRIEDILNTIDEDARGFQYHGKLDNREISYIIDMDGKHIMKIEGKKGFCEIQPPYFETDANEKDVLILKKISGKVNIKTKAGIERDIYGHEADLTDEDTDSKKIIIKPNEDIRELEDMSIYASSLNLFNKYAKSKEIQNALTEYKTSKSVPTIDDFLD